MNNSDQITNYLKKLVEVTDEEGNLFSTYFKENRIKKGQYIIQPDFTAKHRNYVVQGAFRSFVVDEAGQEHTISFAIDDWWISDVNSLGLSLRFPIYD